MIPEDIDVYLRAICRIAEIGKKHGKILERQKTPTPWPSEFFARIKEPFSHCLQERSRTVRALVKASESLLSPFGEPLLDVNLGFLRLISRQKENGFSDWLAYILAHHIMTNEDIGDLFGISTIFEDSEKHLCPVRVRRESPVREGHDGHAGRIDVLLECQPDLIIAIETKVGSANCADTEKQKGYYRSLSGQNVRLYCILLVTDADEAIIDDFTVVYWRDVTLRLRGWVERRLSIGPSTSHTYLALILCFVAAVEASILHFSLAKNMASTATVDYLTDFIERKYHARKASH